ncbi:MAG: leucine--tRNA ligase [Candidatus Aenigmarchaeota archaeon]|nr:leucine--tRNA ligase [Candidatus Aenigmarchaeota archaeon]
MTDLDFISLDRKWQKKWVSAKLFEANPSNRKKFFTSMVIPYVNGNWHVGHSYTFTRTDAYARFKRMQGYNVLLAQGFHATGEPILGAIERLKNGDESQISTFKLFGATSRDIEQFKKKGPRYVAQFWAEKIEESAKLAGFSIDWRRKFTLSLTPGFSRFVEWQYNSLRKKGYVVQGTHPVVWCPKDLSPTGDHDRLQGEGESPQEFTLIKFAYNGYILPAATLRPETLYGVTNVWVADAEYVEMEVDGERWIVTRDASKKLKDQMNATQVGDFEIKEIIGKRCTEPLGNREIPILPSKFVDPDNGTGIVMSVPAHAPYDWIAIKELLDRDELQLYGLTKNDLEPISVVQTGGFGEIPAVDICKNMKIENLSQVKELDEATSQLYKKEFHTGILKNCGTYTGMKVNESKEKLTLDFIDKGIADIMWEVSGVVCRCTTKCHVKILENQWFLKYSDEEWKKKVLRCLSRMKIYPEEARNNFENTIDWLKDKACARKSGLGTPMPWDKEWLIETLSDSTIYMAYYTISHIIEKNKLDSKLTDEVFDFVFLGKGDAKSISSKANIKPSLLIDMKKEFDYFYPMDIRNSGKDLVQNHLTFFIYQHVAMFPESKWPRAISVNGFVNVEGEKMSKSRGNIIPLKDLINQHGADMVRINIAASSEGIDDADWRAESLRSYKSRFELLFETAENLKKCKKTSVDNAEFYLLSRLQRNIENTTKFCEQLMFRSAVQCALFDSINDLKWYLRRTGNANKKVLKEYMEATIKMLAPFTPHACEELYHMIRKDFVSTSAWPSPDENKINADAESGEELIKKTLNDIDEVKRIAKMQPKKVTLFIAEDWKFRVYQKVLRNKEASINDITKEIMSSGAYEKATVVYIQNLYKRINDLQPVLPRSRQFALLKESAGFLEKETGCKIDVVDSDKTDNQKAKSSTPNRFGLFME